MLLLFLLALILNTSAKERSCSNICVYEPADACSGHNEPKCKLSTNCDNAVVCCHLTENISSYLSEIKANRSNIQKLHFRNVTTKNFDISWLRTWKGSSLSITDSRIDNIIGRFPKHTRTSCLNFSSNGILKFSPETLKYVTNLTILDLSHNNLSHVPLFPLNGNITLDISNNKVLKCDNLKGTMKIHEVTFTNPGETGCLTSNTFQWFNSTNFLLMAQMTVSDELKRNCTLKNCSCEAHRIDFSFGQEATLSMMVNCAGRQLTQLPSPLPPNTIALNISNNNITSLDALGDDSYGNLRELYADHNKIVSIQPLLNNPKFISSFNILSLRHNKLKTVPAYVLSNIFDRNDNYRYLNLGQNRLECDCNTAKVLKVWLLNKEKHFTDYEEIFCDNMDLRVVDLEPNKLCKTQQDWTDYIYYIITAEVLLLILLIGKVSYDYWVFKTAGYLPWPASKMPKLPCDWLCE